MSHIENAVESGFGSNVSRLCNGWAVASTLPVPILSYKIGLMDDMVSEISLTHALTDACPIEVAGLTISPASDSRPPPVRMCHASGLLSGMLGFSRLLLRFSGKVSPRV